MRQMFQAHKELEGFLLFYGFGVVRVRAKADLGCNEKALGVLLKLVILEYIYIYINGPKKCICSIYHQENHSILNRSISNCNLEPPTNSKP